MNGFTEIQMFALVYLPLGISVAAILFGFVFNWLVPPANKKKRPTDP